MWVGVWTWHTDRATDVGHFYDFVRAIWEEPYGDFDENDLRHRIRVEANRLTSIPQETRDRVIDECVLKARTILNYLAHVQTRSPS